jgi:signal peptidase I
MNIQAKVKGGSMRPLFNTDSLVEISLCPVEVLLRGDVVVFKQGDGLICHRFFSKRESKGKVFLKVKGDAVWGFDPLVEDRYFLGKVVYLNKFGIRVRLDNLLMRVLGLFFSRIVPIYTRLRSSHRYPPARWGRLKRLILGQ